MLVGLVGGLTRDSRCEEWMVKAGDCTCCIWVWGIWDGNMVGKKVNGKESAGLLALHEKGVGGVFVLWRTGCIRSVSTLSFHAGGDFCP